MQLSCPYCEAKLILKNRRLKENIAFKCPKCKETILHKESRLLPYNPLKKDNFKAFYILMGNREEIYKLSESYYGFRLKSNKLIMDNNNSDFILQLSEKRYIFVNEKKKAKLNGQNIEKKILVLGDCISVGDIKLVFLDGFMKNSEDSKDKELISGAQTLEINIGKNFNKWRDYQEKPEDRSIALNVSKAELIMKSDEEDNITFEIDKRDETTIGRGFTDISIIDPKMSKKHAMIYYSEEDHSFVIEDLKSTNGTFVNGKKIARASMKEGDIILIGNTYFSFKLL